MVTITVEAVPHAAVRAWTANTSHLLQMLDLYAEKVPFKLPAEVAQEMQALVDDWSAAAAAAALAGSDEAFAWTADLEPAAVERLLLYWFNITQLTDADKARLGVAFAPDDARPFADALAAAVGTAVAADPSLAEFASRLAGRWATCQPAFTDAAGREPVN